MKLKNKKYINILTYLHIFILVISIFIIFARAIDLMNFKFIQEFYKLSGIIAVGLFSTTLIPGSMKRLEIGKPIYSFLIYYRRQIGIIMYAIVLFHFATKMQEHPLFNGFLSLNYIDPVLIAGTLSLIALSPVYITSNNRSVKIFKKYWKYIQRVTYIAFLFITLHLFIAESYILFFLNIGVGIFVTISWVYYYMKKASRPANEVLQDNTSSL